MADEYDWFSAIAPNNERFRDIIWDNDVHEHGYDKMELVHNALGLLGWLGVGVRNRTHLIACVVADDVWMDCFGLLDGVHSTFSITLACLLHSKFDVHALPPENVIKHKPDPRRETPYLTYAYSEFSILHAGDENIVTESNRWQPKAPDLFTKLTPWLLDAMKRELHNFERFVSGETGRRVLGHEILDRWYVRGGPRAPSSITDRVDSREYAGRRWTQAGAEAELLRLREAVVSMQHQLR